MKKIGWIVWVCIPILLFVLPAVGTWMHIDPRTGVLDALLEWYEKSRGIYIAMWGLGWICIWFVPCPLTGESVQDMFLDWLHRDR